MPNSAKSISALLMSVLVLSCSSKRDEQEAPPAEQAKTAEERLDRVATKTREAGQAFEDYSYEQKDELLARMRSELDAIERDLDRLTEMAANANESAKADAKARVEVVREKWARAKQQLDEVKAANESNWDAVKGSLEDSYQDLKSAYDSSRQWLSDKVEP